MERYEEKIIDLVDVISGPEHEQLDKKVSTGELAKEIEHADKLKQFQSELLVKPEIEKTASGVLSPGPEPPTRTSSSDIETMVRNEVERVLRSAIGDNIQKLIRDVLTQEVEKVMSGEDIQKMTWEVLAQEVKKITAGENIPKMTREVLTQEVEKAIAREIEILKNKN